MLQLKKKIITFLTHKHIEFELSLAPIRWCVPCYPCPVVMDLLAGAMAAGCGWRNRTIQAVGLAIIIWWGLKLAVGMLSIGEANKCFR